MPGWIWYSCSQWYLGHPVWSFLLLWPHCTDVQILTKFILLWFKENWSDYDEICTYQDSCAVLVCAKFHCDQTDMSRDIYAKYLVKFDKTWLHWEYLHWNPNFIKIYVVIIYRKLIWLQWDYAHSKTAVLPWYVQNFIVVRQVRIEI